MTIHEHQRYSLHQALDTHLGPENAATLMAYLPPVGWADVATKHDLTALEQRLGLRFETTDHRLTAEIAGVRGELGTEIAGLRAELQRGLRTQTIVTVGAMTGIIGAIATATNLFS